MTVYADYVPLTSLTIIRGNSLYDPNGSDSRKGTLQSKYSLYVALNYKPNSTSIGLKELRFNSLHGKSSKWMCAAFSVISGKGREDEDDPLFLVAVQCEKKMRKNAFGFEGMSPVVSISLTLVAPIALIGAQRHL